MISWRWKEVEIEEVKSNKLLGYVVKGNGEQEGQVEDRIKSGVNSPSRSS